MLIVFPILQFDSKTIEIFPEVRDVIESSSIGGDKLETNTGGMVEAYVSTVPYTSIVTIEDKIKKAFGKDWKVALAIAKAESGLDTNAVGDKHIEFVKNGKVYGHSCGIFQIRVLEGRPDCESLQDVDKNIEFAKKLHKERGFTPWSVFNNKKYLKYL